MEQEKLLWKLLYIYIYRAIFMATQFVTINIVFMYQKHRRKGYLRG